MKVACLVSGGVDSSVALKLALDAGYDIKAFYLKIWLEEEAAFLGDCPWEEDLSFVRKTCEMLGVPLTIVPLQREYHERVISYAMEEVRAGRTPNPDVMCNSLIKFGAFWEWLEKHNRSFDKVVTGHYARVEDRTTRNVKRETTDFTYQQEKVSLIAAKDAVKDQTYFLSRLSREQLQRVWVPLGEYEKGDVREMARNWKLPSAERPDSQGLCFLGKVDYREYLKHHIGIKEGDIVDEMTGEVLGTHKGHWLYTIGQRQGLDLSGGPWYVTKKDAEANTVFVAHRLKMPEVERSECVVEDVYWLESGYDQEKIQLEVKFRHGPERHRCEIELRNDNTRSVRLLEQKERGIAPGQFAVFYDGEVCVGSGVIAEDEYEV